MVEKLFQKIIPLLFFVNTTFAQRMEIDSIKKELIKCGNDTLRVKGLYELSKLYFYQNKLDTSEFYAESSRKIAESLDYFKGVSQSLNIMGIIYKAQGNTNKAKLFYTQALDAAIKAKYQAGIISNYNNIGTIYLENGEFDLALKFFYKALELAESVNDKRRAAVCYENIGLIYEHQNNYRRALEYFVKGSELKKLVNDKRGLIESYRNIGECYSKMKMPTEALLNLQQAKKLAKETGDKQIGVIDESIGFMYYNSKDYKKALEYHLKSLAQQQVDGGDQIEIIYNDLGKDYTALDKYDNAQNYLEKAFEISNKKQRKTLLKDVCYSLYELYIKKQDYNRALNYFKLYTAVKDSIFNEQSAKQVAELNTKYEAEKKDRAIEVLSKENAKKEAENLKNIAIKNSIVVTIILIAVLIILVISIINFKRQRSKQKEFSLKLVGSLEAEQMKLSRELHDSVGQELLFLKMQNQGLNMELIEGIMQQVRGISRELHPVKFQAGSLKSYLVSLIENANKSTTIYFTYEIDDVEIENADKKINIYRIVQEAVSNIIKHSGAENARITLTSEVKKIVISIQDDGHGFKNGVKTNTLGMITMKERANLIGGEIEINSGVKGTKIELKIKHG